VLVDEVYLEAMFESAPRSAVHLGPQFISTSSLTKGYGLSGLRCGWILAEPELAERIRLLHDIFGSLGPHPAERLSVVALQKLPKFIARARNILETNRAVLNDFLDTREELKTVRSGHGTTCFPLLLKGRVDDLSNLLHQKYDTAIVPGRFFESPKHFRIGMCAEPELFKVGVERLGKALDELSA
jgi:aspartate/methionine/tyrosine aminotransferase